MYAITGITGKVGGATASALLATGQPVRAILRDTAKAAPWRARGCDIALAEMTDPAALTTAFAGAESVFVLIPSCFDPAPGLPEVRAVIDALTIALTNAAPQRVVVLSTIGAQATQPNLLNQLGLVEQALSQLPMPIAFLRAAWFMENAAWDIAAARDGKLASFLQPLDRAIPMIATQDIGQLAAQLLQETWQGRRIIELEGSTPVSPRDIAAGFAVILGHEITPSIIPRETWETLFTAQGMQHPVSRMQMLDGFNQGWIAFEGKEHVRGTTTLQTVLKTLVQC
jgi:NAD(P)H dehydrogenase (quinone)